jgi:hypothetical protein
MTVAHATAQTSQEKRILRPHISDAVFGKTTRSGVLDENCPIDRNFC